MDSEVSGSSMLLEHFLSSFEFVVIAPSVRRQKQKQKTEGVGFLGVLMVGWKAKRITVSENEGDADTSRHAWPTLTRLCSA